MRVKQKQNKRKRNEKKKNSSDLSTTGFERHFEETKCSGLEKKKKKKKKIFFLKKFVCKKVAKAEEESEAFKAQARELQTQLAAAGEREKVSNTEIERSSVADLRCFF